MEQLKRQRYLATLLTHCMRARATVLCVSAAVLVWRSAFFSCSRRNAKLDTETKGVQGELDKNSKKVSFPGSACHVDFCS